MGTQRFVVHQFGDEDLLVDRAANTLVPLPFGLPRIVGRGGGQRDDLHVPTDPVEELFKRFLPLVLQVMRLVKADGLDAVFLDDPEDVDVGIVDRDTVFLDRGVIHRRMKRLVGDRVQQRDLVQIVGEVFGGILALFEEIAREPRAPLVLDGRSGR